MTAKVDAHNTTTAATTATVAGTLAGNAVTQQVSLAAGQTKTVTFTTHLTNPKVWWPAPLGDHPTYQASLTATVAGTASDSAQTTFGVRDVKSSLDGLLWQYDSGAVTLANQGPSAASGLSVTAETYSLDGTKRFSKTVTGQSVGSLHTTAALTVPKPTGFTGAYLVKLTVKDSAGKEIDRNVYWWSTKTDVLNWGGSDWFYTPQSQFADLTGITKMAAATVSATASTTVSGSTATTTVKLTNTGTGPVPAFFVEATLRDAKGAPVAPVSWSDNDVSLWPGESLTLTATSQTGSQPLTVDVSGVNVARKTASR